MVTPEQLVACLLQRKRAELERQRRGCVDLRATVLLALKRALAGTCARRAWLIGSVAWGGFHARSDVDIVVEGLASGEAVRAWDRLVEALDRPVDLLRFEELPGDFRERVLTEGVVVDVT